MNIFTNELACPRGELSKMDNWGIKKNAVPNFFAKRLFKQIVAAIFILISCIGILSFDNNISQNFHEHVAYYLTSEQADWGPAIEAMVSTGLWMDSVDKGAYQVTTSREDKPYMSLPLSGTIIREFGWLEVYGNSQQLFHSGIDIKSEIGTPIRAVLDGQVIKVDVSQALGRFVEIQHHSNISTVYANCGEVLVKEGDLITQEQIIAKVGKSISGHGQLHFEIREGGQPVDPFKYLNELLHDRP
jgi:murein DD-endopeptidase MepM/ murein hydrolase activator NlpD